MDNKLLQQYESNPNIKKIIDSYLKSTKQSVTTLENAIKEKNFSKVLSIAHQLIGSGTTFGFDDITAIGTELEEAGKAENLNNISYQIDKLQDFIDTLPQSPVS